MAESVNDEWPFDEPKNLAVFTLKSIFHHGVPILFVSHDEDEGDWQFLDGSEPPDENDIWLVALSTIVEHDPTVCPLADLPVGWVAWRETSCSPWERAPHE